MSLLTHHLLKHLAENIDRGISPLRWIDLYSAQYIADCQSGQTDQQEKDGGEESYLVALAVLVSYVSSKGETYLNLSQLPREVLSSYKFADFNQKEHLNQLSRSSAVRQVHSDASCAFPLESEQAETLTPLILWQDRLYLARYWRLHQKLEQWLYLQSMTGYQLDEQYLPALSGQLQSVFQIDKQNLSNQELNWQAISAAHTLLQNFSLITGGPGTGKTTTAASLLHLLMQRHKLTVADNTRLCVRLLAPTGKAAIKLADSIRQHLLAIEARLLNSDLKSLRMSDCLPDSGETIHRFLYEQGALRDSLNQSTPFSTEAVLLGETESRKTQVDIIVIDEASMIDLALMVELIEVIPENAQVIMLGDHYQLPAVEPGQVFQGCVERYADASFTPAFSEHLSQLSGFDAQRLCNESVVSGIGESQAAEFHPLCQLRKTYRFGGELKIAAEQIKQGHSHAFKKQFYMDEQGRLQAVRWHASSDLINGPFDSTAIISAYGDYFECIKNQASSSASLSSMVSAFEKFQLLCSTHEGPQGVIQMNALIEDQFIYRDAPHLRFGLGFYHGKAILVTRNHPHLGVFNGDIGFVMASKENPNNWQIHFPLPNDEALVVAPGRLREWQPAYAMTVHKSQGSEYQHVGIVLAAYAKELLSRALLYTALTRSKLTCDIWAGAEALEEAFK